VSRVLHRRHRDASEPATAKRRRRKADVAPTAHPSEGADGPALRRHREIWYALLTMVVVTVLYGLAYRQAGGFPKAWGLVGHGIGIVGFILILMTETLYSIRKRLTDAKWGSMASWLKFHIYTGLVGPYLVLLHTSMRFHGIAAAAMLFTIVVVASGIVGRYIYTSVPRTVYAAGARSGALAVVGVGAGGFGAGGGSVVAMSVTGPREGGGAAGGRAPVGPSAPAGGTSDLERQARALAARRGRLASWHAVHVPLTWLLIMTALVHAAAALYYVTLARYGG
jgi:hypothetical protein